MPRIIEVTVSPKGEVTIETKGYAGAGCLQASKFLEQASRCRCRPAQDCRLLPVHRSQHPTGDDTVNLTADLRRYTRVPSRAGSFAWTALTRIADGVLCSGAATESFGTTTQPSAIATGTINVSRRTADWPHPLPSFFALRPGGYQALGQRQPGRRRARAGHRRCRHRRGITDVADVAALLEPQDVTYCPSRPSSTRSWWRQSIPNFQAALGVEVDLVWASGHVVAIKHAEVRQLGCVLGFAHRFQERRAGVWRNGPVNDDGQFGVADLFSGRLDPKDQVLAIRLGCRLVIAGEIAGMNMPATTMGRFFSACFTMLARPAPGVFPKDLATEIQTMPIGSPRSFAMACPNVASLPTRFFPVDRQPLALLHQNFLYGLAQLFGELVDLGGGAEHVAGPGEHEHLQRPLLRAAGGCKAGEQKQRQGGRNDFAHGNLLRRGGRTVRGAVG